MAINISNNKSQVSICTDLYGICEICCGDTVLLLKLYSLFKYTFNNNNKQQQT